MAIDDSWDRLSQLDHKSKPTSVFSDQKNKAFSLHISMPDLAPRLDQSNFFLGEFQYTLDRQNSRLKNVYRNPA